MFCIFAIKYISDSNASVLQRSLQVGSGVRASSREHAVVPGTEVAAVGIGSVVSGEVAAVGITGASSLASSSTAYTLAA